jgi:hypothetical protein
MYKKILVSELIEEGQQLLDALTRHRFPLHAALWLYIPDALEWRLVIVTPTVDQAGPIAAYTRLQRVLGSISAAQLTFTDITLISPLSPDYETLVGSPQRLGAAAGHVRNVVFEDAYIYQI